MNKNISITDRNEGDVTFSTENVIARVNPYYALVDGCPLPIVLLEEGTASAAARVWFSRWLKASTHEQIEFCGAGIFWSPVK